MRVFIAWEANIGPQLSAAALQNDAVTMRKLNQMLTQGKELWHSYLMLHEGSILYSEAGKGMAELPAEHLEAIQDLQDKYSFKVDATTYVGIGTTLIEADRALDYAKFTNRKYPIIYTDEIAQQLTESSEEKIEKADPTTTGGFRGDTHAGFHGFSQGKMAKPETGGAEHSQGEAIKDMVESNTPDIEQTHAAKDLLLDQAHYLAGEQSKKDQADAESGAAQKAKSLAAVKQQVASVLMAIKQNAQLFEQVKQQSPQLYDTLQALVQSVIGMAKEVNGDVAPVQKSETEELEDLVKMSMRLPMPKAKKHHLKLPAGSQKDSSASGTREVGKVKVQHGSGTQGWVSVRSGQVLGEDGHAVSARNPGAK